MIIIDGKDMILGKVASYTAKQLLKKENVVLLNAGELIITGNKKDIVNKYLKRRTIKPKQNPSHRPQWPRVPNLLVRKVVRGMLPYRSQRGRDAYRRLRVYIGAPEELKAKVKEEKAFEILKAKNIRKYITVNQLCEFLGYNR